MKNKIFSITKKIPKEATLPDGFYEGVLGGYIIEITYQNTIYELTVEEGVRGTGFKVVVEVKDGVASFEYLKK